MLTIIKEKTNEYINLHNKNNDKIYKKLLENFSEYEDCVNFVMYDICDYILPRSVEKDIRDRQDFFRKELIFRYGSCIISGKDITVCDASHIIPHCKCNIKNMYDVNNGLLLAKEIHELFDKKLLIINPNTKKVELDKKILNNNKMKEFWQYHNQEIFLNKQTWDNLKLYYDM
jgi:hypothetical protein